MKSVLLDKNRHDRKRFDCGIEPLNNSLKVMAGQQARKDNTRTFVLEDPDHPSYIVGYYTLSMTPLQWEALPAGLQKKHRNAGAGGLIARLAVDKRYRNQGYGEWLLLDALRKLLRASASVGFPLVIVDAKEGAGAFYAKYGFTAFADLPDKLFITLADVRASIGEADDGE